MMLSDAYAEEFGYQVLFTESIGTISEAKALRESGLDFLTVHEPEPRLTLTRWDLQ